MSDQHLEDLLVRQHSAFKIGVFQRHRLISGKTENWRKAAMFCSGTGLRDAARALASGLLNEQRRRRPRPTRVRIPGRPAERTPAPLVSHAVGSGVIMTEDDRQKFERDLEEVIALMDHSLQPGSAEDRRLSQLLKRLEQYRLGDSGDTTKDPAAERIAVVSARLEATQERREAARRRGSGEDGHGLGPTLGMDLGPS
jgi:hypothetical protein